MSAILNLQRVLKPKFELRIVDRNAELRVWYNKEWRLPGSREFSNSNSTSTFLDNRTLIYHGTDDDHTIALASYVPPNYDSGYIFGFVRIVENRTSMMRVHMFIQNGNILTNADWYANTSLILGVPADLDWSALISDHTVVGHIDNDLWRWRSGQPIALPKEWTDSTLRWRYIRERADRNRQAIERRNNNSRVRAICQQTNGNWGPVIVPNQVQPRPQIEYRPITPPIIEQNQSNQIQASIEEIVSDESDTEISASRTLGSIDTTAEIESDEESVGMPSTNISPDLITKLELQYGSPQPIASSTLAVNEDRNASDNSSDEEAADPRTDLRRKTRQVLRRLNRLRIRSLEKHQRVFSRK